MAYTINQVIAAVQRRMPDAASAALLTSCNQIHRHILAEIPELRRDTLTINLVAGTQEYAIAETLFQVDYLLYRTGASTAVKLLPTNVESLNETDPTWRADANGSPVQFYISSFQTGGANTACIGLVPAPNTTTSAGYPILNVYGSVLQAADLVGSDTCLTTIESSQVYVEGVSFLAATEIRPQLASAYKAEFEYALQLVKKYVRTRNEGEKDSAYKNIRGGGYQIVVKG